MMTVAVSESLSVTTMPSLPEPVGSAIMTELAAWPVAIGCGRANRPSPRPTYRLTRRSAGLATTTSNSPSPVTSPTASPPKLSATGVAGRAVNVPSPLPTSTANALSAALPATKSGLPSPVTSARAIVLGATPTGSGTPVANAPPWLNRSVTDGPTPSATARSGFPSPFRSPTATATGCCPAGRSVRANEPFPWLTNTLTVPASWFAVTTSGLPSPFRSPTATAIGPRPVSRSGTRVKVSSPLPSSSFTRSSRVLTAMISRLPSSFTSAVATAINPGALVRYVTSPFRVLTSAFPSYSTTSGRPSPFRSPTATWPPARLPPAANRCIGRYVPSPRPASKTLSVWLAAPDDSGMVKMSGMPSPVRSAMARSFPLAPTYRAAGANVPSPWPSWT